MIRLLPPAAFGVVACASALQAEDARLVHRLYDPSAIVRIEGRTNVQATIRFGEDELIENVAIGDSNGWQVTPNKRANLLFVKPLAERATTNMTVVTNAHTYFFDLVANPRSIDPLYELAFSYPNESKSAPKGMETSPSAPTQVELVAASDPGSVVNPASLNFAWASTGEKKLLPSRIYDDGASTYLSWHLGVPVPAILIKDKAGTEGPVNFAVRGDVIVIDLVPGQIILRSGHDVATLTNGATARPSAPLAHLDEVKK